MQKKRTVNFKIATNRPELLNTHIQKIDILLRKVEFFNNSGYLSVKGIIERQVRYVDYDGRNRKTDDLLQFETVTGEADGESNSLFNASLKQNYYIFQPRGFGETKAILEQGFTLVVVKDEPFIKKKTVVFPAKVIVSKGNENVILNFPVYFPELRIEPKYFQGNVIFNNPYLPPMVQGEICGVISFRSSKNHLCEMEFKQSLSILSHFPPLNSGEEILIDGIITDFAWKRAPDGENWLLELKLDYTWRYLKDKILQCMIDNPPGRSMVCMIKAPIFSKRIAFEIPKLVSLPAGGSRISEIKASICDHHEKPVSKGLLAHIILGLEIYTVNENGLETHQEYKVDHDELIPGIQKRPDLTGHLRAEIRIKHVKSSILNGLINIELIIEYLINIYRDELVEITASEKVPRELILAEAFVESKTFSLFGESILLLKRKPVQIIKLDARVSGSDGETKKGWFSISCRLELTVSYLDEDCYFREDVFMIPCRESFLWDRTELSDRVELQGRLDYDSYTSNGINIFYKYMATFNAALFQTKEIKVAVAAVPEMIPAGHETYTRAGPPNAPLAARALAHHPPVDNYLAQIPIEGEVFLKLGKPKEIGYAGFFLTDFICRRFCESFFLEGRIHCEVEYWDDTGYLRRETGNFTFSRLLRDNPDLLPEPDNIQPVIHEYSYRLSQVRGYPQKCLKVIAQLEITQMRRG